jgi:hypothetical protein
LLQRIIVNSRVWVEEGATFDNWDGGIWGHRVHLKIPFELFLDAMEQRTEIEDRIKADLSKVMADPAEYVSRVEVAQYEDEDIEGWREKSGALTPGSTVDTQLDERTAHLWEDGFLRVFLSHKSGEKIFAAGLKEALNYFGISCFVAHEDIEPTKEWVKEIELALFSMEVMVPLMSDRFGESDWTDQEIGVAVGRKIPIVSVRMGTDPYGFIGRYQAVAGIGKKAPILAKELFERFFTHEVLRRRMHEALVIRFERATGFDHANDLIQYIERIPEAPPSLVQRLEDAPQKNRQVRDAYIVERKLSSILQRLRGRA